MQTQNFLNLPLQEKALLTKRDGTLLEMEDYYSYQILKYTLDGERIDIVCDYTDQVISVEMPDKNSTDARIDDQLESQLDD
jgi:hypothetical protein